MLADMATEIAAARHLVYHAAWLKQNDQPFTREAAMAKLYASELAMRATTKAVQLLGAAGYTKEYPVERMMRDAKICEIGEGTSEVQRLVIGRSLFRSCRWSPPDSPTDDMKREILITPRRRRRGWPSSRTTSSSS
jgi:alkylation response protein AidB-like acyl-CoA dehydrogenase